MPRQDGREDPVDLLGLLLLVLPSLAVAVRRRRPVPVAVVTGLAAGAYYALQYQGIFAAVPAMIAIYTVMAAGARLAAVLVGGGLAAAIYVAEVLRHADGHDGFFWISGWVVGMLVIGAMTRGRRDYLEAVEERAVQAERTREEAALRRASEERLWIAQELHDTLTHSISVINVQAGMAVHLLDRDPERGREALVAIREAGKDAMRELRGTLGVLRHVDLDGSAPGLDHLPRLLDRAAGAGLTMTHRVSGEPWPLSEDADHAAYRILQEALTNVLRHAGNVPVTVAVEYEPGKVTLVVDNDRGPGGAHGSGSGMGLIGMRERAIAVGGTLTTGPRPDGGFRVHAELLR